MRNGRSAFTTGGGNRLKKYFKGGLVALSVLLSLMIGGGGCAGKDSREETVAIVDGNPITVAELREFLGIRGSGATAVTVPLERKREALDRLIGGRLIAGRARSLGLDNTDEFREEVKRNGQGVLITAFFRMHVAEMKLPVDEVEAEAKRIRAADNTLTEEVARSQAEQAIVQRGLRKVEEDMIAGARKAFPPVVDNALTGKIASGETVADNAVLATVAGDPVTYGEVKRLLAGMTGGMHGSQDLTRNPVAISRMLDREATGKAIYAHAKQQGIEGSKWEKQVRDDMERSILIDLIAEKEILKDTEVTDKEVKASYEEHAQMFLRDGKRIPFAQVKGQIRQFLENNKRKKALEDYVEELRKKSKVTVNEAILPQV